MLLSGPARQAFLTVSNSLQNF